jgi:type IV/VI secretion system ImpK/VasF family protein
MRLADCFSESMAYTICLLREMETSQPIYSRVVERYDQLLDRARVAFSQTGSADSDWDDSFFATCAWIDEMILCSEWTERDKWQGSQLQYRFFHTMNGGNEFFTRLDGLPADKVEVREVYDLCLALGFTGCYFASADRETLAGITGNNRAVLAAPFESAFGMHRETIASAGEESAGGYGRRRTHPSEEMSRNLYLFPDAYGSGRTKARRSRGYPFLIGLLGLIPVFLFVVLYLFFQGKLNQIASAYFH